MSRFREDIQNSINLKYTTGHDLKLQYLKKFHHCTCKNLEPRGRKTSDGRWQWTIQCLDCGLVTGDRESGYLQWVSQSHPLVMQAFDYIEIDDALRAETKSKVQFFIRLVAENNKQYRDDILQKEWRDYDLFLKSPEWQELRNTVMQRDRHICQLQYRGCTHKATQVHHITYKRWREKHPQDLTSVCKNCHEWEHPHMRESAQ